MRSLITKSTPKTDVSSKAVKKISKSLLKNPIIYFASNEFDYYNREIFGACVYNGKNAEYIKIDDLLNDKDLINFLESDEHKIFYDLKAVKHALDKNKIKIGENSDDLMIMAFLTNSHNTDLESILNHFDLGYKDIKAVYGTPNKPLKPTDKQI